MIKINKITTKFGDKGSTMGLNGKITNKNSQEIEFLGSLDELNCYLGQVYINLDNESLKEYILKLQNILFDIGAMFYTQKSKNLSPLIEEIENNAHELIKNLKELNSFIIPNGNSLIISLHLARTNARKCERKFWNFYSNNKTDLEEIGIFLNRISDYLFAIIRNYNFISWNPLFK